MPIHDWTRLPAGAFADFHLEWISSLKHALNKRVLPSGYYAAAEQVAGEFVADVLTLERNPLAEPAGPQSGRGVAVLATTPEVQFTFSADPNLPAVPRWRLAVRHHSGNAVVAVIEIVSPGNKSSQRALDAFVYKSIDLLQSGIHLLVIDLLPPGQRDPQGIHGVIWRDLCDQDFQLLPDKPLTLAAYASAGKVHAYVQPAAVGQPLSNMPLFLTPELHVPVPLEPSYLEAFERVPEDWQRELKG
jgi:hypothetical protein